MKSALPPEHHLPWWKERMVWLIIGLPLAAVAGSLASFYIAVHYGDDLIKDEYVKTGMAIEANRSGLERAAKLGLAATVSYKDGQVQVQLDKQSMPADVLSLTLVHPTRADLDTQIPLTLMGRGRYQARTELTGQGRRHLILEPPDRSWRLEGEWRAPFVEEASLHAGAQNPSTHP